MPDSSRGGGGEEELEDSRTSTSHSFNIASRDIENQTLGKYRRLVVQMRCEGDKKAKGVESDGVQC